MATKDAQPTPELIDKLKDLGISERSARFALSRTNNNVQQAADYVFSGQADEDEVSTNTGIDKGSPLDALSPKAAGRDHDDSPLPSTRPTPAPRKSSWTFNSLRRKSSSAAPPLPFVGSGANTYENHGNHGDDEKEPTPSSTDSAKSLTQTRVVSAHPSTHPTPPPLDPRFYDQQASDIMRAALGRSGVKTKSASSSGRNSPAPKHSSFSKQGSSTTTKSTPGALAALGLRAAAVSGAAGAQAITAAPNPPPSITQTSAPSVVSPAPVKPVPTKALLQPSRPIGAMKTKRDKGRDNESDFRSRSPSPFFRARKSRDERRARDKSPEIRALRKDSATESAAESDVEDGVRGRFRPQASAYESPDESGNEADTGEDDHDSDTDLNLVHDVSDSDNSEDWDPDHFFDEETEKNTEANAIYDAPECKDPTTHDNHAHEEKECPADRDEFDVYGEEVEQDALGEGPNVIVPPEPLFPVAASTTPLRRRTSQKSGLELVTSRPSYARDRCTITLTQGDPDKALDVSGKRMRRYVVLSDLSEESRYAVEWAIGTVARDGDEVFVISVMEAEDKVDPKQWSNKDASQKLKVQKERQTTALLLVRQVASLLTRTRLNITVTCQALHAKNARYMLLDLIDFLEPTLVIVGSRGLGQLKGILLGSTSHYLVQKSSVPVMVARRRLHRPLRRTNPEDLRHSPRVSLASANIEKSASSKQEDDVVDMADDDEAEVAASQEKK